MRAGTTDRQATVDRLTQHFTEGRLSPDEFDERVGQAYAATYLDELPGLLADLPEDFPRRGPGPGGRQWQPAPSASLACYGNGWPSRPQARPPAIVRVLVVVGVITMFMAVMAITHGFFPFLWLALIPLFIARGNRRRHWADHGPHEAERRRYPN